jgi:hypothetical protein
MDTAFWAVVVAATAVAVNAGVSIILHIRRANFEMDLATKKFAFDVEIAERRAALDFATADLERRKKLAGEILTSFYEIQQIMRAVRSPFTYEGEGEAKISARDPGNSAGRDVRAYRAIIERFRDNRELLGQFVTRQYAAKAVLGPNAADPFIRFNRVRARILTSAEALVEEAGSKFDNPEETKSLRADIWARNKDDPIQAEMDQIEAALDAICRPILSTKEPAGRQNI